MYCVHVFAIVYVFACTIVVCGCICLYVYVPPMRKSGYADHCEVKSSINQSINQSNIYWIHVVGYGCMEFRTKKFFGLMGFHLIIVESLTCEILSILDDSLV